MQRPTRGVCRRRAAVPPGCAGVGVPCPHRGSPGTCAATMGRPGPLRTVGRLPSPSPLQGRLPTRRRSWAPGLNTPGRLGCLLGTVNEPVLARQVLAERWGSSSLLSRTPRDPITCGSSQGQGVAEAGTEAPKPREDGPLRVSLQVRDGPASWLRKRRPGLPSAGTGVCGPFPHRTGQQASSRFARHGIRRSCLLRSPPPPESNKNDIL